MLSVAEMIYFKGSIYRLMKKTMTFSEAQKSCKKWHSKSYLASVHSMAEHDALIGLLKNCKVSAAWLGGSDMTKEGTWRWDDGSKFSWTKWFPGEPNNHGGGQDCLLLVQDLWKTWGRSDQDMWDDGTCTKKFAYVCKV